MKTSFPTVRLDEYRPLGDVLLGTDTLIGLSVSRDLLEHTYRLDTPPEQVHLWEHRFSE